jgi:formylglycine-generating enzyme required for sulfatase activity
VLFQHVQATPAPLAPADPLGRALGEQALRLLAKTPEARPASLAAVVEDVRVAMTPPPSLPGKLAAAALAPAQPQAAQAAGARPAQATMAPNLPPFGLGEGRSVRSVEELVQAAVAKPSDVLWHLGGDPLELWLELIGRADLAKLAATMKDIQPGGGPAALKRFLDATGVRHDYSGQPAFPFDWVAIPGGPFLMGSDPARDPKTQDNEKPQHRVEVAAFRIARTPVTVAQFAAFVEATGYLTAAEKEKPNEATWQRPKGPGSSVKDRQNHPVTSVSWHDALAFCRWADVRLPSEAEWEKAARGIDGRSYPWGNSAPDEKCCNFNNKLGDTTAVGAYPGGASPFGVLDMAGNVWEWTSTLFKPYPYKAGDGRENLGGAENRVLRGGAFYNNESGVRCAFRDGDNPFNRDGNVGFRVVSPGF